MTIKVPVAHTAPVLVAPARAGAEPRLAVARSVTPVTLDEVPAAAFVRGEAHRGEGFRGHPIQPWFLDGIAWHPVLPDPGTGAYDGNARVTAAQLVAWLSGEADPRSAHALGLARAFAGTPLCPHAGLAPPSPRRRGAGGLPALDDLPGYPVEADHRDECAAEVRRIASEEILVADGVALARLRPMLRYVGNGRREPATEEIVLSPAATADTPLLRMGQRPYRTRVVRGLGGIQDSPAASRLRGLVPWHEGDEDLRAMANVLPGAIRICTEPFVSGGRPLYFNKSIDKVRAGDAALAVLERRGAWGLVRPEEVPGAFEVMHRTGYQVNQSAESVVPWRSYRKFDRALDYVGEIAMPRLSAAAATEDADAIQSLAL